MVDNTITTLMPRLRLPQKSPLFSHAKGQGSAAAQSSLSSAYETIAEMPTRPTGSTPAINRRRPSDLVQPLQIGVGWDVGISRRHEMNEDSLAVLQGTCTYQGHLVPFGLFVVADGMGGYECGQEASRVAVQSMMHTVLQNIVMGDDLSDEFLTDMLIGGVEWANLAIFHRSQAWRKEMGTTITAALVVGMRVYIVNVGDSRTYVYREGAGLAQITRDHSLVASLVAAGQIAPDDIYTHPERNKVYRGLGSNDTIDVDWFVVDLYAHDCILLCSDGLWEMVRDPAIERIMQGHEDPADVSDRLVQAALRGGGADNVSAIVVRVP